MGLKNHRYANITWAVLLVGAIYVISLTFHGKNGFWNVDDANKFIQLKGILASHYSDYSIHWPGSTLDPDFEYNPLPSPFSAVKDHRLFSIYSPIFAIVSSWFFKVFGFWGLYFLPLVFSVFMLFGIARIADIMDCDKTAKNLAVLITGLCTPIWFYSVVFWEHIIAVSLGVWGLSFCLEFLKSGSRRCLVLGAVVSSLSIYFRDELYLFCAVLLGAVLLYAPKERLKSAAIFLLTTIISLMPLWSIQWKTMGQPFGFHIGVHLFSASGIAQHISDRPAVLYNLFVASSKILWLSFALTLPFVIAFLLNPKLSEKSFKVAVPLYLLVGLASSGFGLGLYLFADSPISQMLHSNSLFTASPVLILAFMRYRNSVMAEPDLSLKRVLWLVALAYAMVYGLTAPKLGSTGIHWGNRFLLILYPLLAILAAVNLAQWWSCFNRKINWGKLVIVLAVGLSLGAQVYSLNVLRKAQVFSYRLNQEMEKRSEEIIVTDVWWVPQELYSQFYKKPIFLVRSQVQYDQLIEKLISRGYKEILFISPLFEGKAHPGAAEVTDNGLNFFNLQYTVVDIAGSQNKVN
ncbi:MAG: hypothetical protein WCE90_00665 [Candidatus Zixiibacteriota bacterium]